MTKIDKSESARYFILSYIQLNNKTTKMTIHHTIWVNNEIIKSIFGDEQ